MRTLLGLLIWVVTVAAWGDGLGRLFTTPAERRALDEQRPLGALPARIRLEGVVRRPGGGAAVWLNGRPLELGGEGAGGARLLSVDGEGATLWLEGRRVRLKPGQAWERADGRVVEASTPARGAERDER